MDDREKVYSGDVLKAVDAGRKIEAIKLLREETGLGLKDAKHVIDRLNRKRHPNDNPMVKTGGAGGLIKIALLIVIVIVAYRFVTGN